MSQQHNHHQGQAQGQGHPRQHLPGTRPQHHNPSLPHPTSPTSPSSSSNYNRVPPPIPTNQSSSQPPLAYQHQPYQPQQPQPPQQPLQPLQPTPYQPRSQYQPPAQQGHNQYQPKSQYKPQAPYTPPAAPPVHHQQAFAPLQAPPPLSNNTVVIPNRQSSSNLPRFTPQPPVAPVHIPAFAPASTPSTSSSGPAFNHPLAATQEVLLEPPQRNFALRDRSHSETSDRPTSIASASNLSIHSNAPLNPRAANSRQKGSKRMNATGRSITPQPWHPNYAGGRKSNNLDLPEHRDSESDMSRIDLDDDEKRKDGVPIKKKTKLFARLRRARTKPNYKVTGTGRLAQFSNERLYLHWIRFGVLQGSIAVMLLSFGIGIASYIGIGALILALTTLIYATTLYHLRHIYMITKRKDIVYFARTIPTLITIGLMVLYAANFVITMSFGEDARSPPPWTADDAGNFKTVF